MNGHESLAAFLATRFQLQTPGQGSWLTIGQRASAIEASFAAPRFGWLTAWNPGGLSASEARNLAADLRLRERIAGLGLAALPASSVPDDASWAEPGWLLLDVGSDVLDCLAREFDQAGTLFWRRGEPVHLRLYAEHWRPELIGRMDSPFCDWVACPPA